MGLKKASKTLEPGQSGKIDLEKNVAQALGVFILVTPHPCISRLRRVSVCRRLCRAVLVHGCTQRDGGACFSIVTSRRRCPVTTLRDYIHLARPPSSAAYEPGEATTCALSVAYP